MSARKYKSLRKVRVKRRRVFQCVESVNLLFYSVLFVTASLKIILMVVNLVEENLTMIQVQLRLYILAIFMALLLGIAFCCISFCCKESEEINMGVLIRSKFWWLVPLLGVCKIVLSFLIVILYL